MSDHYPPMTPKWAASIWATDAWLYLELPHANGVTKHTVRFPSDVKGLAMALTVIRKRTSESRIGELGDPTRWTIDQISKKGLVYDEKLVRKAKPRANFSVEARATAREILRKVGIL